MVVLETITRASRQRYAHIMRGGSDETVRGHISKNNRLNIQHDNDTTEETE